MRRRLTIASALAASLMAGSLLADHHFMMVVEVFPGTELQPNAQYIVLQMWSPGQNIVNTHSVQVTDPNGNVVGTFTFAGNVGNGADQAKILIATPEAAALFNVAANLAMAPVIQRGGGRVCFNSSTLGTIDCVAWGGYTGPATGVGTPIASGLGLRRGTVIRRKLDICGSASNLDSCDDTNNSNADWLVGVPTPQNNAGVSGTTPPSTCGNGILESIEGCDDGGTTVGDGCSNVCSLEQGADVPRGLVVDASGNGVLDPGETVVVAPEWRNVVEATRNVDGDMVGLTGPVGGTYNRTDLEAGYGMLAENDEAACGGARGCFALNVPVPVARPSLHWSASMLEVTNSLTTKPWDVHIGNSFVDVSIAPTNPYYRFIETLLHNGVTGGCGGNLYCPGEAVTREQMSVFLLVSKEGLGYTPPACVNPPFNDVPCSSGFAPWIQELVVRQVTAGCGGGNYCPTSPVTREQMAVFLLVTLEPGFTPPPCVTPTFDDVPCASVYAPWIEELARRGITGGCSPTSYCPTSPVTREQMAVFLTVTFDLLLYGP